MFFRRPLLIPLVVFTLAPLASGQEAAPSGGVVSPAPLPAAPRLSPGGTPGAALPRDNRSPTPESPLMPDQAPSLVKPEAPAREAANEPEKRTKTSKTEAFEQEQSDKIRFRQVHTQALADQTVQTLWDKSNTVRKDAEKRQVLKEYYKLLYARMAKIDPTLKKLIDLQATNAERRLTQTRLTSPETLDEGERSRAARVFAD